MSVRGALLRRGPVCPVRRRGQPAVWRPYERLGWPCQEAMLEAAASALHLAEAGAITARGTLAPLLARQPHRPVYEGDRPVPAEVAGDQWHADMVSSWRRAEEDLKTMLKAARSGPAVARHILAMLTIGCQTPESFNRERQYLTGLAIPTAFLPTTRDGLLATGQVTTRT